MVESNRNRPLGNWEVRDLRERMNIFASQFGRPLKKPPAMLHRAASLTLVCVSVLPIRNRLSRKFPQRRPQHAQLMVVNRDLHPSGGKEFDSSFELVLIVMRVDPKRVHIA